MRKSMLCALAVFLIIIISFSFFLVGCDEETTTGTSSSEITISNKEENKPDIIVIKERSDGPYRYKWICEKDTYVMYLITSNSHGCSITPLYNPDGTLRRYTPPP